MNKPVFTFWYGGELKPLHLSCINSWMKCGHTVSIYSYEPLENAPDGVTLHDASSVISRDYFDKLIPLRRLERASWQPIVSLSDLFRMKGMERGLGCWLDTDVFLFRPVLYQLDCLHLAWEQTGLLERKKIGVSVMYIPSSHPIVADYLRVLNDPNLMPNWIGFSKRYIKCLPWILRGLPFRAVDISITAYGNLALRKLVVRHKVQSDISPKISYYHWTGKETSRFFTDPLGWLELNEVGSIGIHVHRKQLADSPVISGTLYAHALQEAGLN